MTIKVDSYGLTDIGRRRDNNEDHFFIGDLSASMKVQHTSLSIEDCSTIFGGSQGHLFLVADGLGGHAAGERASALAISTVAAFALNSLQWLTHSTSDEDVSGHLQSIAVECQKRLMESARHRPSEQGMATTLTLAIVFWPRLYVIHIGDSRCYLVQDGEMKKLTRDHTLGQLYSEFSGEDNTKSGANHALWNVVSSDGDAAPIADVVQLNLADDDQLLLCTDGLYNHVNDAAICDIVNSDRDTRESCCELVSAANRDGGKDNITVVLSRFSRVRNPEHAEAMVETRVPLEQILNETEDRNVLADTDEINTATMKFSDEHHTS